MNLKEGCKHARNSSWECLLTLTVINDNTPSEGHPVDKEDTRKIIKWVFPSCSSRRPWEDNSLRCEEDQNIFNLFQFCRLCVCCCCCQQMFSLTTIEQSQAQRAVHTICILINVGIASVQFEVINSPGRKRVGIHFHVILRARVATTGLGAKVFVDAKLQAFAVNLE